MRTILSIGCVALVALTPTYGAVSPSPFLPPGYNSRSRPTPPQNKPKPQTTNVQIAKEIEFGGYFSLGSGADRKLFFSLFNKKVNHGQWVTIGEKTDEDFLAEVFDFDTETLTVRFGATSHDLSLRVSKGSPAGKSGSGGTPRASTSTSAYTPGKPRVMPPRPKTTPALPPWLASRVASGTSRAGGGIRGSSTGGSRSGVTSTGSRPSSIPLGYVPRRINAGTPEDTPSPSTGGGSVSSNPITSNLHPQASPATSGGSSSPNPGESSSSSPAPAIGTGGNTIVSPSDPTAGNVSSETIDLSDLPPPPPPPDILPPGPPPNIVPSRED